MSAMISAMWREAASAASILASASSLPASRRRTVKRARCRHVWRSASVKFWGSARVAAIASNV